MANMDKKLEQMIKERIEVAEKQRYPFKLSTIINELGIKDISRHHMDAKKLDFRFLEMRYCPIGHNNGSNASGSGHYDGYDVNFQGQSVFSHYNKNGFNIITSYIPGVWEADFDIVYQLAKQKFDAKESLKEQERLRKQEAKDVELLKKFGINPNKV